LQFFDEPPYLLSLSPGNSFYYWAQRTHEVVQQVLSSVGGVNISQQRKKHIRHRLRRITTKLTAPKEPITSRVPVKIEKNYTFHRQWEQLRLDILKLPSHNLAYIHISKLNHLLPSATEPYENGYWILQQGGAPAHLAESTQYWCLPTYQTPQNGSPELNVLDFSIWAMLEQKACQKKRTSVQALRKCLEKARNEIPQDHVRATVEAYPKRLKAVIRS
ncbi:hypothetical protein ANCDUO_06922, partial [Ancylostoma duodenale]